MSNSSSIPATMPYGSSSSRPRCPRATIVICSAIDITERKIAEQVISKAREDLEQRVKDRTDELMQANDVLKSEIQERKRFESAIQLANRKLNTLSSITRHDILNQITAIVMYLSLAEETVTDPGVVEQLKKIEQVTDLIQKQIRFTRDYQTHRGECTPVAERGTYHRQRHRRP